MKYPCPCCRYLTLTSPQPGTFEICPVCFWEDDELQVEDPGLEGGANQVSLEMARNNFTVFGASERRFLDHVRKPHEEEIPIRN